MAQPKKPKSAVKPPEEKAPQEKFLKMARMGKEAWNAWLRNNPNERANFIGIDFTLENNKGICFSGFRFENHTDFSKTTFGDVPEAYKVDLGKAAEQGVSPEGSAIFTRANFRGSVCFDDAEFGDGTRFDATIFGKSVSFDNASFLGRVLFSTDGPQGHAAF